MPTLNWIGKDAVVNHHKEVPFHLLKCDEKLSVASKTSEVSHGSNLLVQGDNLLALKALLPHYTGQVKCIYIDPPYNTGNRDFIYNDRFINKEDGWRHSKWIEFMHQRLLLAKAIGSSRP